MTDALRAVLPARARRHPVVARLIPRAGLVQATLPGGGVLRMDSLGDDNIASDLYWRGWACHEPETARLFYELAASARVTLDIGAHVGYFALLAAHANPQGRVYAFEPLPRVRERLQRNVALNGSSVLCEPFAVGSPAGTAEFFHVRDGIPSSSSLAEAFMLSIDTRTEITSTTVEVIEVDGFVESRGITGVDLVKIDTETTEAAVLQGMLRTLRRDRPQVVCEVLDADVARAIEALVKPLGYEYFALTSAGPQRREQIRADHRWRNYLLRPAAGD